MLYVLVTILVIVFLIFVVLPLGLVVFFVKTKNPEFSRIFESMMDKMNGNSSGSSGYTKSTGASDSMSKSEALEILGLKSFKDKSEVNKSYHKLMQSVHPDKGGSAYLARKLTQARDVLIKK